MKTKDARRRGRARPDPGAPFIRSSRSARSATSSLVPPGARLSRRISSCRRGSEAKCRSLASSSDRLRAPGLDRLRQPFAVRAVIARQRLEERQPAGLVELAIAVEHLARDRDAGRLAAARQQRLAQFDQFGGVLFAHPATPPRRSRVRPRSEIEARRSEKKALLLMSGGLFRIRWKSYTRFKAERITIKLL